MLQYPHIDPIALSIGPVSIGDTIYGPLNVHWYGLMYLCAFICAWAICYWRAKTVADVVAPAQVENLITYGALGVVLGGRMGYVIFYNFDYWMTDPLWLFRIWEGGMSFHGGLLGVIVAMVIYANRAHKSFLAVMDFIAPAVPLGLFFGRIGNFIGQELWGRVADVPWAMVFPRAIDPIGVARHPSQLYQAALEGLLLFIILMWLANKKPARGLISGAFLLGYAVFRSFAEFFREPDAGIGFDAFEWVTRGQLLCLPMFALGCGLMAYSYVIAKRFEPKASL
jgi:phosphatidylglycerol:prolipoprotein diacylglycerol transferase